MRTVNDRLARAHILWLCVVVGLVLVYSKWWSWYGGWFWGPRFFLFASLPAALVLATRLHLHEEFSLLQNLATLAVLGWSLWVGINGAVFGNQALADVCVDNNYALESFCWYLPEYSVLFRPFIETMPLSAAHIGAIAYGATLFVYLSASLLRQVAVELGKATRDFKRALF
jgi:hypothetical protein